MNKSRKFSVRLSPKQFNHLLKESNQNETSVSKEIQLLIDDSIQKNSQLPDEESDQAFEPLKYLILSLIIGVFMFLTLRRV